MNKKGWVQRYPLFFAAVILIVTVALITLGSILHSYHSALTEQNDELASSFLARRFTHSPDCFAFQYPGVNRVLPGSIDVTKFTDERMNWCYASEQARGSASYNFRLELVNNGAERKTDEYSYHDAVILHRDVLVVDGGEITPDTLRIYVQPKLG